jgi:AcrR family transcriptional regulator
MKNIVRRSARAANPARLRLPRGEREGAIVQAAAALFAEQGFAVSTRQISDLLGVTQALLYRYFPSKQALIERVLAECFGGDRWNPEWDALLADRKLPLVERLVRFYEAYRRRSSSVSLKLWVQARAQASFRSSALHRMAMAKQSVAQTFLLSEFLAHKAARFAFRRKARRAIRSGRVWRLQRLL